MISAGTMIDPKAVPRTMASEMTAQSASAGEIVGAVLLFCMTGSKCIGSIVFSFRREHRTIARSLQKAGKSENGAL